MFGLLALVGLCLVSSTSALNCLECSDSFYEVQGHKLGGTGICTRARNSTECRPRHKCLSVVLEYSMPLEGSNIIAPITLTTKSCVPDGLSEANLCRQVESTVYDQDVRDMRCEAQMCNTDDCNAESSDDSIPDDPDDVEQHDPEAEEEDEYEEVSREDYEKVVRCLECTTAYTITQDGSLTSDSTRGQKCNRNSNTRICRFGTICSILKMTYDTDLGHEQLHSTIESRGCAPKSRLAEEVLCDEAISNLSIGEEVTNSVDCSVKLCDKDYCNDPNAARAEKKKCPYKNKKKCRRYHAQKSHG